MSQRGGLLGLAMHQKDASQRGRQRLDPRDQLALIGVAAEFVEAGDLRPDAHGLAEDSHLRPLLNQLAAEGVLRLKSGDEHGIARVLDIVAQVMQDAEKTMLPFVAMNPTEGYYSPTKDSKYPAIAQRLYENVNDVVLGRQPFSYLDQVAKEWLDNGGNQMRTEFEKDIAASRDVR